LLLIVRSPSNNQFRQGAHALHTLEGTIVVDGFIASSYAHLPDVYALGKTLVSAHTVAHLALSPISLARKLGFKQGTYHDDSSGRHRYIDWLLMNFAADEKYEFHLHEPLGFLVVGASAVGFAIERIVDAVLASPLGFAMLLSAAIVVSGRRKKKLKAE